MREIEKYIPIEVNVEFPVRDEDAQSVRDRVLSLAAPFSSTTSTSIRDPEEDIIFSDLRDMAIRATERHFLFSEMADDFLHFSMQRTNFESSFGEHPFFSPTRHVNYPSLAQAQFPTGVTSGSNAEKIERIANFSTETIPTDYICPLSLSIMSDPTYIPGDVTGQRFERSWITTWLNEKGSHPTTRVKFQSSLLQPDFDLKHAISHFIQAAETASSLDEKPTASDASVEPITEGVGVETMDTYIPEPMRLMRDNYLPIRHQTLTNEDEALAFADRLPGYR